MKLKDGFMLRRIVDTWVVVPLGERVVDFNGILTLTDSAARLWQKMQGADLGRADLLAELTTAYEVDEATAARDLDAFLDALKGAELLAP